MPKILKTKSLNSKKRKDTKPLLSYFISSLKGITIVVIGLLIVGFALYKGNEFSLFWKLLVYIFIFSGGLYCGFSSFYRTKDKGFLNGIISTLIYILLLMILIILLMRFQISLNILLIIPIGIVGGIMGRIIRTNLR